MLHFQRFFHFVLGVIALCAATACAALESTAPTMVEELFAIEQRAGELTPAHADLLREILDDALAAARAAGQPKSHDEAVKVLEAIQRSLVDHNLVPPPDTDDWVETIGEALSPVSRSRTQVDTLLEHEKLERWAELVSRDAPLYFVDCDMGALLFMAVGQKMGWDIRLVEIPYHNFVRWHLGDEKINWDWVNWAEIPDSAYYAKVPRTVNSRLRLPYVDSYSADEAHAYFLAMLASKTRDIEDAKAMFLQAKNVLPEHPVLMNNIAWLHATTPDASTTERADALAYALAGWSFSTEQPNRVLTAACALAANQKFDLALAIAEDAVLLGLASTNLDRIRCHKQCTRWGADDEKK